MLFCGQIKCRFFGRESKSISIGQKNGRFPGLVTIVRPET